MSLFLFPLIPCSGAAVVGSLLVVLLPELITHVFQSASESQYTTVMLDFEFEEKQAVDCNVIISTVSYNSTEF